MKKFAAFALLLLMWGAASAKDIPPEIIKWSMANVWHVGSSGGSGTGFFVDNDTMVTACHVVDTTEEGLVLARNDRDTRVIEFKVALCDKETDVAVLKKLDKTDNAFPLPTLFEVGEFGQEVWGAGYGLGLPLHINPGHFFGRIHHTNDNLATNATIMGDSGSPILGLNDEGQVVVLGLISAVATAPDPYGYTRQTVPHLVYSVNILDIIKGIKDANSPAMDNR